MSVTSPNEPRSPLIPLIDDPLWRLTSAGRRGTCYNAPRRRVLFDIDLTDKEWLPVKDVAGEVSAELCDKRGERGVDQMAQRVLKVAFGTPRSSSTRVGAACTCTSSTTPR